ncbi:hypothetical protein D9613_000829 [Agrocybe pediades]|uniref:Aminoglycoside phosphotransferase domain-containing protein n=1 Tax=Agrocybe pediades TaxID=84607 RepID=A0A8H4VUZ1_9AGAR|nr:hypothetical protein D9613_000829 [Agrocybe pediades]
MEPRLVQEGPRYASGLQSDGAKFVLNATETTERSSLLDDFDYALLLVSMEDIYTGYENLHALRCLVKDEYWGVRQRLCIVITKCDLLSQRPFDEAAYVARQPQETIFYHAIDSVSVSALNGVGMAEMCTRISNAIYPNTSISLSSCFHAVCDRMTTLALDLICSIFALPMPKDINKDTPDTLDIPNDEFADHLKNQPEAVAYNRELIQYAKEHIWEAGAFGANSAPTWKIAPNLICKTLPMFERQNASFVRRNTNIPVPQPRYPHLEYTYVTDFIPGQMLHACWDNLGFFKQFRVACTLRKYVNILRTLTRETPGAVDGGHVSNYIFEFDPAFQGPFKNAKIFRKWCEYLATVGWHGDYTQDKCESPPTFPESCDWGLNFTHGDLSLLNLILTENNILWVIDWEHSGFYPRWTELAGMARYRKVPQSWKRWWPFICGGSYAGFEIPLGYMKSCATMTWSLEPRSDFFPPGVED